MANSNTNINNNKISKQNDKIRKKMEKQKNLEKVVESHSLKYYGYFTTLLCTILVIMTFIGVLSILITGFRIRKISNYIDTNNKTVITSAKSIDITPYSYFGYTSTATDSFFFDSLTDDFTSTWSAKSWTGLTSFSGGNIWSDGTNIYYSGSSNQYVLDKSTSTWSAKTWNGFSNLNGSYIWTDGTNIYYSLSSSQYVLDLTTSTWTAKSWTGLSSLSGNNVWSDGTNIYYSGTNNQYVLNKSTSTWSVKTWNGLTRFSGNNVWTDGTNIYYSESNTHYILDKNTSTWSTQVWNGYTDFRGAYTWTDGTNVFYSEAGTNYVLDKNTSTWSLKTWNGLTSFRGSYVWSDGSNIYLSDSSTQYVLNKFLILDTPSITLGHSPNGSYISWSSISNAVEYHVYKDNSYIDTVTPIEELPFADLIYDISSSGVYKVVAIGDDINYSDSSFSNTLDIVSVDCLNTQNIFDFTIHLSPYDYNYLPFYILNGSNLTITTTFKSSFLSGKFDDTNDFTYTGTANLDSVNLSNNNRTITAYLTNITSDFTFDLTYITQYVISGTYAFIGSQNYSYNNLPSSNVIIDLNFVSNGTNFTRLFWNVENKNISYVSNSNNLGIFTYNFDTVQNYFSGFLYLPQNTANYYFITLDNATLDIYQYDEYFSKLYRVATLQDYENLGYNNGLIDSNQYTMANLIFAIGDTPIKLLKSLLNFNFFGVNLFALASAIVTLLLVFAVFTFVKGGKNKGGV